MPAFSNFAHYTEPQAAQILRRYMGGTRNLVSLILTSASVLLSFFASLVNVIEANSMMSTMFNANGADASAAVGAAVGSILGALLTTAVSSLGLVSWWMIYGAARSRKSPMGTAGFTMQKVLAIVSMSLLGLELLTLLGILFIFSLFLELILSLFGSPAGIAVDLIGVVMVVYVVIVVLVMAYSVFVLVAQLQTTARMKATARTGLPGKPIPLFYIINLFIAIAFSVFALLFNFIGTVVNFSAGALLLVLAALPAIGGDVLRAIVLLGYRSELKELQNFSPSSAPAVPPAPAETGVLRPYSGTPVCPRCGAVVAPGTRICPRCGSPMVHP